MAVVLFLPHTDTQPAMTSKLKTAKKGKGSKSKVTAPKIQVTTVSALFKRQIQQQESRETESDDDVTFVKEERSSPYFSPSKLHDDRSVTLSGPCTDEKNIVRAETELGGDLHTEKRLSGRLSLKKARSRTEDSIPIITVTSSSVVWACGDADSLDSRNSPHVSDQDQKGNASHSQAICETVPIRSLTVTVQEADCKESRLQERKLSSSARTHPEGERSIVHNSALESSSSRGKLSLKRKKKSAEDVSRAPLKKSPPKPQDAQYAICVTATESDTGSGDLTCATTSTSEMAFTSRDSSVDQAEKITSSPEGIDSVSTSASGISTLHGDSSTTSTSKTAVSNSKSQPKGIQSLFTSTSGIHTIDSDSSGSSRSKTKTSTLPKKVSASASELKITRSSSLCSEQSNTPAIVKHNESEDKGDGDNETGNDTEGMHKAEGEDEEINAEMVYRVPYYLENFKTIVKSVFEDEYYLKLFDHTDFENLAAFNHLSEAAQKLYVRLFSRKLAWLPTSKIKYPEIAEDLTPLYAELVSTGLVSSGDDVQDLSAVLRAMSAPDLRTLAKLYHINSSGQQKGQITLALLAKCQQSTVASMFGQKIGAVRDAMLKRAKNLLGPVYRLQEEPRKLFMRAMMLFSLINTNGDEESGNGGQAQLFQMLMVNIGRVVYPTYTVNRQTQVFRCREDLKR